MNRNDALELVKTYLKNKNLMKHCLAVEACMKAAAARLGHDPDPWGLAGLVHDLDYEQTEKSPELHTTETVKILKGLLIDPAVIHAVDGLDEDLLDKRIHGHPFAVDVQNDVGRFHASFLHLEKNL